MAHVHSHSSMPRKGSHRSARRRMRKRGCAI